MLGCCEERTQHDAEAANKSNEASHAVQEGVLNQILSRVNETVSLSKCANATMRKASSLVRGAPIRSFQRLCSTLITMVSRLQKTSLETYQVTLSIRSQLPGLTAQCRLNETPSILVDCLGRRTPLPLQFINSWAAFEAVLEVRFQSQHGHQKVLDRQYVLQDSKRALDLERDRPWDGQVLPGQEINMEMIFGPNEYSANNRDKCPGCNRLFGNESSGLQVEW